MFAWVRVSLKYHRLQRQGKGQVISLRDPMANLAETPAKRAGVIVNEF